MIPIRDHNPASAFPLINNLLIAVNVTVYFYTFFLSEVAFERLVFSYAFIPADIEFFRLITSQFLHGSLLHLAGNMLFLHIFGENLEDSLGRLRYLVFYLISGILANLAQYFISPFSPIPILGASGAIAGVMGGYLVLFPRARVDVVVPLGLAFPTVTVPAFTMLVYWIAAQFLYGLGSLNVEGGGVAYFAHIGGFVAGLILIRIFPKKKS